MTSYANALLTLFLIVLLCFFQQHGVFTVKKNSSSPFKIGAPERKILIAFSYYIVATLFALTTFTLSTRASEPSIQQLFAYFACEVQGVNPAEQTACDESHNFRQYSNLEVTSVAFVLLNLFPTMTLAYALNVQKMKEKCVMCWPISGKRVSVSLPLRVK